MAARVRAQLSAQQGHEFRTHQTTFVMALLRPGIGKEYIHTGEALIAHLIFDELAASPHRMRTFSSLRSASPRKRRPSPGR